MIDRGEVTSSELAHIEQAGNECKRGLEQIGTQISRKYRRLYGCDRYERSMVMMKRPERRETQHSSSMTMNGRKDKLYVLVHCRRKGQGVSGCDLMLCVL